MFVRRSGLTVIASVLSILGAIGVAAIPTQAIGAQPFSAEERARAIAEPSVVFLEFTAIGVLRERATGTALHTGTTTVTVRCSGVVVDQSGAAVTAKTCVAPDQGSLDYWGKENISRERKLGGEELKQFMRQDYILTGDVSTEPPQKRIMAQANTATVTGGTEGAWKAEVVGDLAGDDRVAVVKIEQSSLPALQVARFDNPNDVLTIDSTIATGYSPVSAMSLILRGRPVTILEKRSGAGDGADFALEQELPWESRGGAITDMDGRLVGVLAPASGKIASMWASKAISDQLAAAGVPGEQSSYDKLYREGLNDYFEGRYGDAADKLDEVALNQLNSSAAAYRDLAAKKDAEQGGSGTSTLLIVTIVAGVLLVIALVVIVMLLLRQRSRRTAGAPVSAYPAAYGSPVQGYHTFNPVSAPPQAPMSASPYDTGYGGGQVGDFPPEPGTVWPAPPQPGDGGRQPGQPG